MKISEEQKNEAMAALERILTPARQIDAESVSEATLREFLARPDKQKHRHLFLQAMTSPQLAGRLLRLQQQQAKATVAESIGAKINDAVDAITDAVSMVAESIDDALVKPICVIKIILTVPGAKLSVTDTTGSLEICSIKVEEIQASNQVRLWQNQSTPSQEQFFIKPEIEPRAYGKFWLELQIFDITQNDISDDFCLQASHPDDGLGTLVQPGTNTVYLQRGGKTYAIEFHIEMQESKYR